MAALGSYSFGAVAQNACVGASPVNPESRLAADTGRGGMGGTGVVAEENKTFVGLVPDTSGMGGTGIVGLIAGFASICVNGEEIHYDDATPVTINGRSARSRELTIGQLVVVHAEASAGRLRAKALAVVDAVAGPVSRIDRGAGTLEIMGQVVRSEAAFAPQLPQISAGASVRVSGHRLDSGEILATRIDLARAGAPASTHGSITGIDSEGFIVNGTRVAASGANIPAGARPGMEVFVSGQWNGSVLSANRVQFEPVREAIARAERVIIEGFVHARAGNNIDVGGLSVNISEDTRVSGGSVRDVETGRRVRLDLRKSGEGRWSTERIDIRGDDRERRGASESRGAGSERDRNEGPGPRSGPGDGDSGRRGGDDSGRGSSGRADSPAVRDPFDSGRDRSGLRFDPRRSDTPLRPESLDRDSGRDRSGPRYDPGRSDTPLRPDYFDRSPGVDSPGGGSGSGSSGSGRGR